MSLEILKGSAKFKMGISQHAQLVDWLNATENIIGFAFTGRSNVGKSSLINSLFGKSTARTSKTPGRTREVNIFEFNLSTDGKLDESFPKMYLFDLPGYGHAEVSKEMGKNWNLLMSTLFESITNQVKIINIQDSRHPNQKADQAFHSFLKNYDLDTTLVFNKIDKLKKQKERAQLKKVKPLLFEEYKWVKFIHFASAEAKTGVKELQDSMLGNLISSIN